MKERKETISIVRANVLAVAILAGGALLLGVPFGVVWKGAVTVSPIGALLTCVMCLVGIVVHELLHGVTWACFAKRKWHSVHFGVMWKMLTPYCHCDESLRKSAYMLGAFIPCLVLGVVPTVAAFFTGRVMLLIYGVIFISAAAGDLMVMWRLRKEKSNVMVQDHPSEAGYLVYEEDESDIVTNKE